MGETALRGSPTGTRFRLFAQAPFEAPFLEPETVWVSSPPGTLMPGPADDRMYVVDPIGKSAAYGRANTAGGSPIYLMPPWRGPAAPPAMPDKSGHFDHIPLGTPQFEAAHLFGAVRRTLDLWENYFGHPLHWHFFGNFNRLELVIQRNLVDNAYMGYGFLEVGVHPMENGNTAPLTLNFDVIAHEVGHFIVFAAVGVPDVESASAEYYGFHESAADLTALIAALGFDSVIDDLLATTHGNLYALNAANRIAELSNSRQIRLAANAASMADFVDGWSDEHDLAQPLTGAIFDTFVDIFHEELVARGLITAHVEDLSDRLEHRPDYHAIIQPLFDKAYLADPTSFRAALIDARDTVGIYLAETWRRLPSQSLSYADIGETLLWVDRTLSGGRFQNIIHVNLRKRGIGMMRVGPRLRAPRANHHFNATRLFTPLDGQYCCRKRPLYYRQRVELAHGRKHAR